MLLAVVCLGRRPLHDAQPAEQGLHLGRAAGNPVNQGYFNDVNWTWGGQATVGYRFGCCCDWAVEGTYWGLAESNSDGGPGIPGPYVSPMTFGLTSILGTTGGGHRATQRLPDGQQLYRQLAGPSHLAELRWPRTWSSTSCGPSVAASAIASASISSPAFAGSASRTASSSAPQRRRRRQRLCRRLALPERPYHQRSGRRAGGLQRQLPLRRLLEGLRQAHGRRLRQSHDPGLQPLRGEQQRHAVPGVVADLSQPELSGACHGGRLRLPDPGRPGPGLADHAGTSRPSSATAWWP